MNPILLYLQSYPHETIKLLVGPVYFKNQTLVGFPLLATFLLISAYWL